METTATTTKILNSWTLLAFARMKGKLMVADNCVNKDTGDKFTTCVFVDPSNPDEETNKTWVPFSKKLGVLTPQQIVQQKDSLQVVERESGKYALCKKGENSWTEIDLGI